MSEWDGLALLGIDPKSGAAQVIAKPSMRYVREIADANLVCVIVSTNQARNLFMEVLGEVPAPLVIPGTHNWREDPKP